MTVLENMSWLAAMCAEAAPGGWLLSAFPFTGRKPTSKPRARAWRERVALSDQLNEQAGSLPYGAQRRLEIARALATEPRLLLLDEPAAGMNPQESLELMHFIGHIRDEFDPSHPAYRTRHESRHGRMRNTFGSWNTAPLSPRGYPDEIRSNPLVIRGLSGRGHGEAKCLK